MGNYDACREAASSGNGRAGIPTEARQHGYLNVRPERG